MARAREALGGDFAGLSFFEECRGPRGEQGEAKATPEIFGDPVIARKDHGTSYHLASVVDDAQQGVTHVIRGEDLYPATQLHRLLQALLDLPSPRYHHHRLITDENGKRFAKRRSVHHVARLARERRNIREHSQSAGPAIGALLETRIACFAVITGPVPVTTFSIRPCLL